MDHILYQVFKIIFEYIFKRHGEKNDNPSIIICVNKTKKIDKIENKITLKIKIGYYLEVSKPETMK